MKCANYAQLFQFRDCYTEFLHLRHVLLVRYFVQGDSGGPLACRPSSGGNWTVAGVMSWMIRDSTGCLINYPSMYTRVSGFLGWIAANTP